MSLSDDMIDTVREAMLVLDSDLRVVRANESFCRRFEVLPEQTIGHLIYELGNRQWDFPELRDLFSEVLAENQTFTDYLVEHEFPRIGRRVMLLNVRKVKQQDQILFAIDDITERKQFENAIRESEERFRLLVASWAQAFWETDAAGFVVTDSPSWREYTGQSLDQWLGYGWVNAIHPDDRQAAEQLWRDSLRDELPLDAEFRLRRAPDDWRWTNVRAAPLRGQGGQVVKWVGMNIDIDGRKQAEAMLREREARYSTMFQMIDEGFCVIEVIFDDKMKPVDYCFLEVNPAFERQSGLANPVGRRMREMAPGHEEHWFEIYGQVALTGEPVRFERFAKSLGREFDVFALRVGEPSRRHVAVIFTDVTQRKQDGEQLRMMNESLEGEVADRAEVLHILQDVTRLANESRTLAQAVRAAMARIAGYDGWKMGHYWRLTDDGEKMISSGVWSVTSDASETIREVDRFRQACRRMEYQPGEGLVGGVVKTGEARRTDDLSEYPDPLRKMAELLGVCAAIAFPVTIDGEVVAVLEFFSDHSIRHEQRFLEIMPDVGIQLGHVLRRKRLEKDVADIAAQQQRHFASQLHDSVQQQLVGVTMMADSMWANLAETDSPYSDQLKSLAEHVREAQQQIRRLSHGLMPVDVDAEGLMNALQRLVADSDQAYDADCRFICEQRVTVEDNNTAMHLYHITQEAIQNAIKHGEPARIDVALAAEGDHAVLTIVDDGSGFHQPQPPLRGSGHRIMQYRADLIGGELNIDSRKGTGVTVSCRVRRQV